MRNSMGVRLYLKGIEKIVPVSYYADVFITLTEILKMQIKSCMSNTMERKSFGGPRNFGPREMTKAVCSDCGKECEVPFKPTEGRPVFCRDCLPKHRKPRF
jgi:CxxC-x17-CxxC domain-containing protein